MEKQSNTDFQIQNEDQTLISSDGQPLIQAIQNRKPLYVDETGILEYVLFDNKFWVSAELNRPITLSKIKHWRKVFFELEQTLKTKQVYEIWCLVSDVHRYKFAKLFGLRTAELTIGDQLEVMRKELL